MNNKFFQFVETYREDIVAFFNALIELLKTIFGDDEAADGATE